LECARNASGALNYSKSRLVHVNCDHNQNAEVWDRGNLAISQLTIEVDSQRFGGFIGCDAQGPNATMDCHCTSKDGERERENKNGCQLFSFAFVPSLFWQIIAVHMATQTTAAGFVASGKHGNEYCSSDVGRLNLTNPQGQPYGVWSHGKDKGLTPIDYWRYNIADLLGGHWYSTPSTGRETPLFAMPFILYKMHHFTKTGSGQT
jgi:hypothetical protein